MNTSQKIRALREESYAHGDLRMAEICDIALGSHETPGWDREKALAECERVIAETAAQRVATFVIEIKGDTGRWSAEGVGDPALNSFESEDSALLACESLKLGGGEWADAEYRVREV